VATEVDLSKRPFWVKSYNKEYLADTLIITTGASPNHLNVPGEKELTGRGVSYCAPVMAGSSGQGRGCGGRRRQRSGRRPVPDPLR
jgi:thioredoxin reductase